MKRDFSDIHLHINSVEPFINDKDSGFIICWSSDIGFGEYTLTKTINISDNGDPTEVWYGDSECMDSGEHKEFIEELMKLFVSNLVIDN